MIVRVITTCAATGAGAGAGAGARAGAGAGALGLRRSAPARRNARALMGPLHTGQQGGASVPSESVPLAKVRSILFG